MGAFPQSESARMGESALPPKTDPASYQDADPGIHPDRARARRLRDEARGLGDLDSPAPEADGSGVLLAMDECVAALLDRDSTAVDQAIKQDRILSACLRDLDSGGDGAKASSTAAALRGLADSLDDLEERQVRNGRSANLARLAAAPLIASGLAGAALIAGARSLPEPSWEMPGWAIVCGSVLAAVVGSVVAKRAESGRVEARRRIDHRAQEVLARARVVVTDSSELDAQTLRERAEQVARRDLLTSLRARLEQLLLDSADREQLGERRALLVDSRTNQLSARSRDELVAQRSRFPALAMPGIAAALEDAFERVRQTAHRRGAAEGLRRGLTGALEREAGYLEERAARCERERDAERLLLRLTPPEAEPVTTSGDHEGSAVDGPHSGAAAAKPVCLRSHRLARRDRGPTDGPQCGADGPRALRNTRGAERGAPPSRLLRRSSSVPFVRPLVIAVQADAADAESPTTVSPTVPLTPLGLHELPSIVEGRTVWSCGPVAVMALERDALPDISFDSDAVLTWFHPVMAALEAVVLPRKAEPLPRTPEPDVWPPAAALRDAVRRAGPRIELIQKAVQVATSPS